MAEPATKGMGRFVKVPKDIDIPFNMGGKWEPWRATLYLFFELDKHRSGLPYNKLSLRKRFGWCTYKFYNWLSKIEKQNKIKIVFKFDSSESEPESQTEIRQISDRNQTMVVEENQQLNRSNQTEIRQLSDRNQTENAPQSILLNQTKTKISDLVPSQLKGSGGLTAGTYIPNRPPAGARYEERNGNGEGLSKEGPLEQRLIIFIRKLVDKGLDNYDICMRTKKENLPNHLAITVPIIIEKVRNDKARNAKIVDNNPVPLLQPKN